MKRLALVATLVLALCQNLYAERMTLKEYNNLGGDFTLTDHNNQPFQLAKRGKIVLLFFGYLNCPDICPTTLVEMIEVKQLLGANASKVEFVFVTLDPDRDSSENLKSYLANFDPAFIGIRGSKEQIAQVAKQYNVLYKFRELRSALGMTVDHSAAVYMIDTQAKLRFIFPSKSPSQRYMQGLEMMLKGITQDTPIQKGETWLEKMMK